MPHADFVHLRVHSAYSLSEGAITPKALAELAKRNEMPAVAVTDTGNLFGAMEFAGYAKDAGVQPITGCLLGIARPDQDRNALKQPAPDRLLLLAQSEAGYANLMKLSSKAFLASEPGTVAHIVLADLDGHTDGLIALTGGPSGQVGRLLGEGQGEAAAAALQHLMTLFRGRLYVELMRHGTEVEERIEPALIDLAYQFDLPLVATNDVYFSDEGMYLAHDALLCIAEGTYVGESNRRRVTREHRFKSAGEMRRLFRDIPEACDNTLIIAQRCAFMPPSRKPILPPFSDKGDEIEILRQQAREGLDARLEIMQLDEAAAKPYRERLEFELGVIIQMGFPG
jgi:DNA polymerase-3 subunit alpha